MNLTEGAENISDFVDDSRSVGNLDSSGSFQIDRAKALMKSKNFGSCEPGTYLLLVVQLAYSVRAENLVVSVGRAEVKVRFTCERWILTDALKRESSSTESDKELPSVTSRCLHALCAAASNGIDRMEMSQVLEGQNRTLNWESQSLSFDESADSNGECGVHFLFQRQTKRHWFKSIWFHAAEHILVSRRCMYAFPGFKLDGRAQGGSFRGPGASVGNFATSAIFPHDWLVCVVLASESSEDPGFVWQMGRHTKTEKAGPGWAIHRESGGEYSRSFSEVYVFQDETGALIEPPRDPEARRALLWIGLPKRRPRGNTCTLELVKNGVLLNPVERRFDLPCRVIASVPTAKTDLSELAVVEDKSLDQLLQSVREKLPIMDQAHRAHFGCPHW